MKDLSFTVPPEYSGAQVKTFLRRGCGVSAKLLSQCKKMQNGILKNGKPVWAADTAADASPGAQFHGAGGSAGICAVGG